MKVLYTGSFNPFHNGHQYVYDVACKCFGKDNVWIGIGKNASKPDVDINKLAFSIHPITLNVIAYEGLTADLVKSQKFELIIRGVRPGRSLEDENDLLYWNRKLSGGVETILIPTPPEVNQISSGAIREMARHKLDVSEYTNPFVYSRWQSFGPRRTIFFGRCCSGKSTFLRRDPYVRSCDELVWHYLPNAELIKTRIKEAFYAKNDTIFNCCVELIGSTVNWYHIFDNAQQIDFPNLGTYWKYIPLDLLHTSKLVRVSTSMENRKYFAKCRKANPLLIKLSDKHYIEPPFWDEEKVIERV